MGKKMTKAEKLFDYVSQGRVLKVKSFLKKHHRFDLNTVTPCRTQRQRTLLHVACASGDDAVLRVLLKHGARADVQDSHGDTPLHLAIQRVLHGHRHAFNDLVKPILKRCSANVLDIANNRGHTSRELLHDTEHQENVEHLTRNSARWKDAEEWQTQAQKDWAEEAARTWGENSSLGENSSWEEQGSNAGREHETFEDWSRRVAAEEQQRYEQTHHSSSYHTRRQREKLKEEETKRKEEAEWQARIQEEWADDAAGYWGENSSWEDQGQEQESFDDWAKRISAERKQKQEQQRYMYERTHPSSSHRTRQERQREKQKEEQQRKFQEKLQEEHERYHRRHSERLHKKLLRQKEEYRQRCDQIFGGGNEGLSSIGYDDIPWPCHHSDPGKMIEVLMCDVDKNDETEFKKFMRSQQLLWHPDKFLQKCGTRLVEGDRSKILERVTELSQALNRLGEEDKAR